MHEVQISLTIDASKPEQLSKLQELLELIGGSKKEQKQETKASKPKEVKIQPEAKVEAPTKEETKAEDPKYTIEEVRAVMRGKIQASEDNRAKIKAKMSEFGASSVSGVKKEDYSEFMDFLKTL